MANWDLRNVAAGPFPAPIPLAAPKRCACGAVHNQAAANAVMDYRGGLLFDCHCGSTLMILGWGECRHRYRSGPGGACDDCGCIPIGLSGHSYLHCNWCGKGVDFGSVCDSCAASGCFKFL
jgi:hypothetical protein